MKLLVEFNLTVRNYGDDDVRQLCVDISDRVNAYLMSRELSWDKVRVSEFKGPLEMLDREYFI